MNSSERAASLSMIVGISGTKLLEEEKLLLSGISPLGVILFKRNYENPQQLRELTAQIKDCCNRDDVVICADQEGGRVQRFGEPFTIIPSARVIGSTENEYLALEVGKIIAAELLACGVNMNLAPVCDINTNPQNRVISDRAYGETADIVMRMSESVMNGLSEAGVLTCAKHFPGHGDTLLDSHEALPVSQKSLSELYSLELLPFINIAEKGVDAFMMAHILFENIDPGLPASMSRKFMDLLRNEIAFEGVIMTDDMEMKAVSKLYSVPEACSVSVANGADVVLLCHTPEFQKDTFERLKRYYLDNPQKIETKLNRMEKFLSGLSKELPDISVVGCNKHKDIVREVMELANI